MKILEDKKKLLLIFVFLLLAVVFFILLFRRSSQDQTSKIQKILINKDGHEVVVLRDGSVLINSLDGSKSEVWDEGKTEAFFGYYEKLYLGSEEYAVEENGDYIVFNDGRKISIKDEDELSDIIIDTDGDGRGDGYFDDRRDGSGGEGGGYNGDVDGWFPMPTPSSYPTSTTSPTSGGGDNECLYWRLSYCVRPRTPTPSPVATKVPSVDLPPTCTESINRKTGRTVISNELCVTDEDVE